MLCNQSLRIAFEAVAANRGCAGVDGVTIGMFGRRLDFNVGRLEDELGREVYRPLPLMQILVAKKNGEPRKLCIPMVRDRVQYSVFECNLDDVLMSQMTARIEEIIDQDDDSVRIYSVCAACLKEINIIGTGEVTKDQDIYVL